MSICCLVHVGTGGEGLGAASHKPMALQWEKVVSKYVP